MNVKLDQILTSLINVESRLTGLEVKLHYISDQVSNNKKDITEIKEAVSFLETQYQSVMAQIDKRVISDRATIKHLEDDLDNLENRSRRNNVVIHGIPEGSEGSRSCEAFLADFFDDHMKLEVARDIEIERAHRNPANVRPSTPDSTGSRPRSRPIQSKLLRYSDRQLILKNASKLLKTNPYKSAKIFISDDVSVPVRNIRKQLRDRHLPSIRSDKRVEYAFIPLSIPPVIRYKLKSGAFRSFRLGEATLL